ncbi:TPA: bifunctional 4-hydroxy-2-oxoglutarate aldolase/2-dehydro-3-deoxy-phosphogluconate aldolase, partial [Streptococcus agalactiae]
MNSYFFSILLDNSSDDLFNIVKDNGYILGGIRNIEVTFSTPEASKVIKQLSDDFKNNKEIIVGAGTVMTTELAKEAIDAGAKFLVSPHFDSDIANLANEN